MTDLSTVLGAPDRSSVPRDEHGRPRVLIEEWLPIAELGVESIRERNVFSDLPPLFALHVWWARRPMAATSGVLLASLLPSWSPAVAEFMDQDKNFVSSDAYRRWFLRLTGTDSDVVSAYNVYVQAKADGRTIKNPYGHPRTFKTAPSLDDLRVLHRLLVWTWGELPTVLDPTAGGGTVPFTAARYRLPAVGNDLNQVAAAILRASVEAPVVVGDILRSQIEEWGKLLADRCSERLKPLFATPNPGESVVGYIWANAVRCPRTGKVTPLAPDWYLSGTSVAAEVLTVGPDGEPLEEAKFQLRLDADIDHVAASAGTVSGGVGRSVWDDLPVDRDYIKEEAQAGRMTALLYAVAVSIDGKARTYRNVTERDRAAVRVATEFVSQHRLKWENDGIIPTEEIPLGSKTAEPLKVGIRRWQDLFTDRQLACHAVFVEEWRGIRDELEQELGEELGTSVAGLLALMQGKALNWNARLSSWDKGVNKIRSVFDTHNLAFKWTFAEFDAGYGLWDWTLSQLIRAYGGLCGMLEPGKARIQYGSTLRRIEAPECNTVRISRGTAAVLGLPTGSVSLVCMDPPYYSNVMYAELSDFFGVWEQHTVGTVWGDLMPGGLADVASEAVANVSRFAHTGKRKKGLATLDYEAKMQAIFAEAHRVLADEGVLTVMFTHKKAEAWDTLGMALMEAGFQIEASWPVNTEAVASLHIARKNAAESTIMLVCRKRPAAGTDAGAAFFDDLVPDIRNAARNAVQKFAAAGIDGVDLLLSSYGPVLSVISEHWPVLSSEADESGNARRLRPEEALDIAREELLAAERRALVGKDIQFDPPTDFVLFAWNTFKAAEFPYDDARKLAVACAGSDIDELVKGGVASKKTGTVTLRSPKERIKQTVEVKTLDPKAGTMIDRLWGILAIAESSGLAAAKAAMDRAGMSSDQKFSSLVQAAVNAVPRTKKKGEFTRPEAEWLDKLASTYFAGSVELPEDPDSGRLFDVD
jgi:putative DNA methylase